MAVREKNQNIEKDGNLLPQNIEAEEALKKSTEPWFVEHVYSKLIEKM